MFVPSLFLSTHFCLSTYCVQRHYPLSFSHCLLLFLFDSTHPSNPYTPRCYLHASPTCIFLCGWWTQQALANVSSAASSSLQPLMMRKPLLRHWCRVCRQSDRLKHRLTWVADPRERQRTDRLIDWASLRLCTMTQCAPFLFQCCFFMCILFEFFLSLEMLSLVSSVPCINMD